MTNRPRVSLMMPSAAPPVRSLTVPMLASFFFHFTVILVIFFLLHHKEEVLPAQKTDSVYIETEVKNQTLAKSEAKPEAKPETKLETKPEAQPQSVAGVARQMQGSEYLAQLRAYIESKKKYPPVSRTLGEQGRVEVAFLIKRDGKISDVRIVSASRFEKLNSAARKLVEDVGFFKAIPPEFGETEIHVTVPVVYEVR